jgi:purine nucleoside phosphorylase
MSTTHEAVVAYYCGLKVLALSIVTDMTVDVFDAPPATNHEEVVKVAKHKAKDVERLVIGFIDKINKDQDIFLNVNC